MKKITIKYMSGIGDFLDENKISWKAINEDTIQIILPNTFTSADIFCLGLKFQEYRDNIN